jgi:hypothetical protein
MLQEELLPSINEIRLTDIEFIFQQNSAICLTAKTVSLWLHQMNIPALK